MDWKDKNKIKLKGILERFGQAMTQTLGRSGSLLELGLNGGAIKGNHSESSTFCMKLVVI